MPNYTIKSAVADTILYAGNFSTFARCVETALHEGLSLRNADFSHANLLNAELDGGDFRYADFTCANLSGANLSEANLRNSNFTNAILHGAVLCNSDIISACFEGTLFGATEIAGAVFRDCLFSTLSAFTLKFDETEILKNCRYINPCGTICPLSRQPFIVHGLSHLLVIMDKHIKVGHDVFSLDHIPDWITSIGLSPHNLRLRLEQIVLALILDDRRLRKA